MRTLNRLERMPHVYIAEVSIPALELAEAVRAFSEEREYSVVSPFVARFDEVVSPFRRPPTHDYITYGLAHTVYELWRADPNLFESNKSESARLEGIRKADRSTKGYRDHNRNFQKAVARNLELYRIAFPQKGSKDLADWIWTSPSRCPAFRLGYEVFHKIVRNVTDSGEESDIPDFAHIDCIPYVDAVTLDRRMRGYVMQASHGIRAAYGQKLHSDVNSILALLHSLAK